MQHPKDVKGSDKSLLSIPVGQRYTTILDRLDAIESEIKYMKESIEDLDNSYHDIESRLDKLEEEKEISMTSAEYEELSNEEYLLADKICLEIKEYMSQFVDTDEKVVDNLCEIVKHRIVGDSDGIY